MYGAPPPLSYQLPAALPPYNYLNYIPHYPIYAERLPLGQYPMHPLVPMSVTSAVAMSEANMAHNGAVAPGSFVYYAGQMGTLPPPSAAQVGIPETRPSDSQQMDVFVEGASPPLLRDAIVNRLPGVLGGGYGVVLPRSVVDAALPPASTPLSLDGMGEGVDPETLTTVHSFLVCTLRRLKDPDLSRNCTSSQNGRGFLPKARHAVISSNRFHPTFYCGRDLLAHPITFPSYCQLDGRFRRFLGRLFGQAGTTIKELTSKHNVRVYGLPGRKHPAQDRYVDIAYSHDSKRVGVGG